jgi:restriction system protein
MQVDSFHYPPELFELLVETIPLLNRSKKAVLDFFRGAGVSEDVYNDLKNQLTINKDSLNKYEIARAILSRINEKKDLYIRERRELLKRITEFETFTNCWENDQYKAKGLVSEIRNIINVKDSFTRMSQERDKEVKKRSDEYNIKIKEIETRAVELEKLKSNFYSLFSEQNPQLKGKKLEQSLNNLFKHYGILLKEAFTRSGEKGEGILEQIDGVVEIDNQVYLVEMKWRNDKISVNDVYSHLGRMYHRTGAYGIFISASGFSPAGLTAAKEALLKNAILVLMDLQELVIALNSQ